MKTRFVLIAIISLISLSLFSQDVIVTKGGKQIICKLSGEDSANVYYSITKKRVTSEASISRAEIQKIIYKTRLPYVSTSDSIVVRNNVLFYKGRTMTTSEFMGHLQTNPEAYKKYKSAGTPLVFANILSGVGGGLIGWQLGTSLGGGEANWGMAGIGGGLILLAIPVASIGVKNQKTAINIYNKGVTPVSLYQRDAIKVGFASSGIGIRITF
jgi:hypothetical protein